MAKLRKSIDLQKKEDSKIITGKIVKSKNLSDIPRVKKSQVNGPQMKESQVKKPPVALKQNVNNSTLTTPLSKKRIVTSTPFNSENQKQNAKQLHLRMPLSPIIRISKLNIQQNPVQNPTETTKYQTTRIGEKLAKENIPRPFSINLPSNRLVGRRRSVGVRKVNPVSQNQNLHEVVEPKKSDVRVRLQKLSCSSIQLLSDSSNTSDTVKKSSTPRQKKESIKSHVLRDTSNSFGNNNTNRTNSENTLIKNLRSDWSNSTFGDGTSSSAHQVRQNKCSKLRVRLRRSDSNPSKSNLSSRTLQEAPDKSHAANRNKLQIQATSKNKETNKRRLTTLIELSVEDKTISSEVPQPVNNSTIEEEYSSSAEFQSDDETNNHSRSKRAPTWKELINKSIESSQTLAKKQKRSPIVKLKRICSVQMENNEKTDKIQLAERPRRSLRRLLKKDDKYPILGSTKHNAVTREDDKDKNTDLKDNTNEVSSNKKEEISEPHIETKPKRPRRGITKEVMNQENYVKSSEKEEKKVNNKRKNLDEKNFNKIESEGNKAKRQKVKEKDKKQDGSLEEVLPQDVSLEDNAYKTKNNHTVHEENIISPSPIKQNPSIQESSLLNNNENKTIPTVDLTFPVKFFHSRSEHITTAQKTPQYQKRRKSSKRKKQESIYEFLSQSSSDSTKPVDDVIQKMIATGKAVVAKHKKGTGKMIVPRIRRPRGQQKNNIKANKINEKPQPPPQPQPQPQPLQEKIIEDDISHFDNDFQYDNGRDDIEVSEDDHIRDQRGFSSLARSTMMKQAGRIQKRLQRKPIKDKKKLLEMALKYVSQSTPVRMSLSSPQQEKPRSGLPWTSPMSMEKMSPVPQGNKSPMSMGNKSPLSLGNKSPMSIGNKSPMSLGNKSPMSIGNRSPMSLGNGSPLYLGNRSPFSMGNQSPRPTENRFPMPNKSPWRVDDDKLPRTFYLGRNSENLPSFSSDYIPMTPSKNKSKSKSMSSFSSNDSNGENQTPPGARTITNEANLQALANTRKALSYRSPLKAINILEVVNLPPLALHSYGKQTDKNENLSKNKPNETASRISPMKSSRNLFENISNHSSNNSKSDVSNPNENLQSFHSDDSHKTNSKNHECRSGSGSDNSNKNLTNLFGFEDLIEDENENIIMDKTILPNKENLKERLHRLKKLRPNKPVIISNKPVCIKPVFDNDRPVQKTIKQMLCSTMINQNLHQRNVANEGLNESEDLTSLFKDLDPETTFDDSKPRRTYNRPIRKRRKAVPNFAMFIDSDVSDDEHEEDVQPVKCYKAKAKKRQKTDNELNKFVNEFNEMCKEVSQYELVVE